MAKYFFTLGVIISISYKPLFAQTLPPIQLDRPDQTECPFITPKKYIQVENGFSVEKINSNQRTFIHPTSLWKYGVNERFELRLITEFISQKNNSVVNTGLSPITIGFKAALLEEKGIVPKTAFIGHITTPKLGSKNFHTTYIAPSFRFVMQHTLSPRLSLSYNLGAEWDGENAAETGIYTLTTGFGITDKLGVYAELYGFLPKDNRPDHRCDAGLTYLLNDDLIVDISGGFGISENSPKNYLALGISYRFKVVK